jgi:CHAT domain-containing protein
MRRKGAVALVLLASVAACPARGDEPVPGAPTDAQVLRAAEAGDAAETLDLLERRRARRLVGSLAGREALRGSDPPPDARAREEEARARRAAAWRAELAAREASDRRALRDARPATEAARRHLAAVIRRVQADLRAAQMLLDPSPAALEQVRARLRSDEALVVFALLEERAFAVVVAPDGGRVVSLGSTHAIEEATAALIWANTSVDPTETVEPLRLRVMDPLGLPAAARRLLLSPEGPLANVPFALLAPARETVLVPSASAFVLLRDLDAGRGGRAAGTLAVGDPRAPGGLLANGLPAIPTTAEEARAVGDVVVLRERATVGGLLDRLGERPRWGALHVAAHSLVNAEEPDLSGIALSPGPSDDGVWTAVEVARTRVEADLVVLSAVEGARGSEVLGEGTVRLADAFLEAGAPRVVGSLVNLDDDATLAFARAFHERWKAGRAAGSALKEAQDVVRAQRRWRHPFHWAGWVLIGLPD